MTFCSGVQIGDMARLLITALLPHSLLYVLSAKQEAACTIFNVFGMTRPRIEPQSPAHEANTLPLGYHGGYEVLYASRKSWEVKFTGKWREKSDYHVRKMMEYLRCVGITRRMKNYIFIISIYMGGSLRQLARRTS